jgi:hypothetical protein
MTIQQRTYTLDEARSLSGAMVYALSDKLGVFYVGRTRNPSRRFYQHKTRTGPNIYLAKRLRESGASVLVRVISIGDQDLLAAELDAIREYGATLLNFHANPARLTSSGSGVCSVPCPQCGGALDHPRQKLCKACTGKLLAPESKADLRALAAKAVADFRK